MMRMVAFWLAMGLTVCIGATIGDVVFRLNGHHDGAPPGVRIWLGFALAILLEKLMRGMILDRDRGTDD